MPAGRNMRAVGGPTQGWTSDSLRGRLIANKVVLGELLGMGAIGRVYRARHVELDKDVAVKVLSPDLSLGDRTRARFRAEARAASRLNHPHSVQVLDFGEDGADRLLYLVTELLEGETMEAVLRKCRRLPEQRAVAIMGQVCSALAAAHDRGVIHRDVKPSNIMLSQVVGESGRPEDFVKVCDFGLAKVLVSSGGGEGRDEAGLTQRGAILGTPSYMSPEQVKGERVDHRSDIYSCGVVLYRSLSGMRPFSAETAWATALKHIAEEAQPLDELVPTIPPALAEVVRKAMRKKPDERFSSARELKRAMEDAIGLLASSSSPSISASHADGLTSRSEPSAISSTPMESYVEGASVNVEEETRAEVGRRRRGKPVSTTLLLEREAGGLHQRMRSRAIAVSTALAVLLAVAGVVATQILDDSAPRDTRGASMESQPEGVVSGGEAMGWRATTASATVTTSTMAEGSGSVAKHGESPTAPPEERSIGSSPGSALPRLGVFA